MEWVCVQCGLQISNATAHQRRKRYCSRLCHNNSKRLDDNEKKQRRAASAKRWKLANHGKVAAFPSNSPAQKKRWRELHPEQLKASQLKHYQKNKTKILKQMRGYYLVNRDRKIAYQKAYGASEHGKAVRRARYVSDREKINAQSRASRALRRSQIRERHNRYLIKWRSAHRDAIRNSANKYAKKAKSELRDNYVRNIIRHTVPIGHIPPQMVEATRRVLRVKRALKELLNETATIN